MLLDDAAIVPVYQRGRAYLQRDSIKNMYNHKYGGDLSFKWASVEIKKQVIACFLIRSFLINAFSANLVPARLYIQTFVNKLHFSFPPKSFSPMLFVMTPINAVIPMMRAATVIKSIKSNHLKTPLCLSVCLLYEIKMKKKEMSEKYLIYFRNRVDRREDIC